VLPVISPDFGHSERRVDREFGQRFIRGIDFNDDIRRRVRLQIDFPFADNPSGASHMETSIGLGAFLKFGTLPSCRSTCLERNAMLFGKGAHHSEDEVLVLLVFGMRAHDLEFSFVVADAKSRAIVEISQKFLVFFPTDLLEYQSRSHGQMVKGFKILCASSAHGLIIGSGCRHHRRDSAACLARAARSDPSVSRLPYLRRFGRVRIFGYAARVWPLWPMHATARRAGLSIR